MNVVAVESRFVAPTSLMLTENVSDIIETTSPSHVIQSNVFRAFTNDDIRFHPASISDGRPPTRESARPAIRSRPNWSRPLMSTFAEFSSPIALPKAPLSTVGRLFRMFPTIGSRFFRRKFLTACSSCSNGAVIS